MLDASAVATAIPSLWSAVNSWFTPAVLFLLLNLMIATIALTSSLNPATTPSHDIPPYPHELQQQRDEGEAAAKQSPSISILDRVKSLGLFSSSPGKSSSPQQRQPIPLIPPEELYSETHDPQKDLYGKQGLGQPGSPSPVGKFEAFDLYGYLPGEPTSEIPRESNPTHYIFEQTLAQEVLVPAKQSEKVEEEVGEEEDAEADEEDEEEEEEVEEEEDEEVEEEETGVEDGSEEERETKETEVPGRLLHRGIRRSESLNVKVSFSNVGEAKGGGGARHDEGEVTESVEKRRPATVREGKGKWGGDEEVDARAADFISRFKEQLQLQRMDSLAKQKDVTMIGKVRSL
ncbi:hypothetical protein MLD38_007006 [Melastoma candidum]|uniref:Uncharacterized protein n=1 Tax=Melastoma candidum TaxID=119954 RepID=A0ACB9RQY5_9MYRT|nr:hypothetical protein MLD38_007006 [Melastoma candidum]